MIRPLVEGLFLGLTVAIIIGPAMIALIQTSIKYGAWHGIYLALGIFSSDLTIAVGSYFGASQILGNPKSHLILGIIGGSILILFGIATLVRKVSEKETVEAIRELKFNRGGFFVVAINSSYGGNSNKVAFFFAGTLLMVLMTDILKAVLANKIRTAISPQVKLWINRIAGILFLIIGLFVIGSSISEYFYGISLLKGQLTQ